MSLQGGKISRSKSWCIYYCHISISFCCHVWWLGAWNMLVTCDTLFFNQGKETLQSGHIFCFCLIRQCLYVTILAYIKLGSFLSSPFWWNLIEFNSGFTEARRHHGDDLWWSLCHFDDVNFLNLHRFDLQWVLLCPLWTVWPLCICLPRSFLQVYDLETENTRWWPLPFNPFFPLLIMVFDDSCRDATTDGLIKVRQTYPFGLDPVWHGSRSELPFLNSLKMKMSILLGVAQMNLGIILSYFNGLYFKNNINIW